MFRYLKIFIDSSSYDAVEACVPTQKAPRRIALPEIIEDSAPSDTVLLPETIDIQKHANTFEKLRSIDQLKIPEKQIASTASKINQAMKTTRTQYASKMLQELFSLISEIKLKEKIFFSNSNKTHLINPLSDFSKYGLSYALELQKGNISSEQFFISVWRTLRLYVTTIKRAKPESIIADTLDSTILKNSLLLRYAINLTALGYKPLTKETIQLLEIVNPKPAPTFPLICSTAVKINLPSQKALKAEVHLPQIPGLKRTL